MRGTILLADAAQAVGGELYILGGGWSVIGPLVGPYAIALKIEVPWDMANHNLSWEMALLNADGQAITGQTPAGEQPIRINGQIEVGRPPGLLPGTPLDVAFVLQIPPIQLGPGQRYMWQFSMDGTSEEDWQATFYVRPVPQ